MNTHVAVKLLTVALLAAGAVGGAWAAGDPSQAQQEQATRFAAAEAQIQARVAAFQASAERNSVLAEAKRLNASSQWQATVYLTEPYRWAGDPEIDAQAARASRAIEGVANTAKPAKVAKAKAAPFVRHGVRIGMTMDDVVAHGWGKPIQVNRTTTAAHSTEQWVYPGYQSYLYFTDGVLTAVQN